MNDRHDRDPLDALRARAERGTPVGHEAVLGAARSAEDPSSTDAPAPTTAVRSHRWALTAAAAAIVLVAAGVGAAITSGNDSNRASSSDPFCRALEASSLPPYDIDADVIVYVEPGASTAAVDELRGRLDRDPQITAARYVGVDQTYERFRRLFQGQSVMLDNVKATDLPTSFEVTVARNVEPGEVAARWRADPAAWEVRDRETQLGRVLDALVWPGVDPRVTSDDFVGPMSAEVQAGWDQRLQALRSSATPEVLAAVDELALALRDRRHPLSPEDPDARDAAAAAATLTKAARTECGLTPRSPANASAGVSPTTTTTATGGD